MLLHGIFVANKMYINCFHTFSIVLYVVFLVLCGNSVLCGTLRFFAVISDTRKRDLLLLLPFDP